MNAEQNKAKEFLKEEISKSKDLTQGLQYLSISLWDSVAIVIDKYARMLDEKRWTEVSPDKMPENGKSVIGYFPRGDEGGNKVAPAITYDGEKLISDFPNSTACCFEATHYMKFPEPPNSK